MIINPYISFPTGGILPPQGVTLDIYTAGNDYGDQTSQQNNATTPYNMYYNFSCLYVMVTAQELNSLVTGGKTITGVQIENGVSGTTSLADFRITCYQTTDIFLSTTMETDISQSGGGFTYFGGQICFNGTYFPTGNNWNTINFQNQYQWNGSSNLVIKFENRSGSYIISGRPRWLYGSRNLSYKASLFQDDYDDITTGSFPMITTGISIAFGHFPNLKINY